MSRIKTRVKIPTNPQHRCFTHGEIDKDVSIRERIIIERKDITFPALVAADVYGALEVFISDEGEMDFLFVLIRKDDQIMCPEFELGDDFLRHVNNEFRHTMYCKPMREAFGISGDISNLTESHLNGIWLARCLAEKFKFTADISFNGMSSMTTDGTVVITMIRTLNGQEKVFMAKFNDDEADLYIGGDSPEGSLYFGRAA
ncbi:hypothetical protein COU14_02585 [Candidatus Kaiserbacteria bacterium CG10_big_fil_rev_8_21_14_0_10_44_10]|uniref:Uncharacterized protein n=1 Tax=Candidatus Kaiserbacteria bacterium CG10_big_fil_rev_8_21_14_0_10_44_10 TaxID=1974606 RepID=A0A2H0UH67_9BACT|nr:MAG: hypothetical protein COU14_02585 [Candidatus Kaiserbacteria bacterium CG10_big_fil_rev_8_21_14_0_10_44_10]